MAKQSSKKNGSKTAAIRAELKKTNSPKEVAKRLTARGIKVTPQYVSTIKANDKKRERSGTRGKVGRPRLSTASGDLQQANDLMLTAIDLVMKAGPEQARELIGMAEKIVERTNG